ncbi:MAG: ABC-three component system protein [Thermosynechococcaceae cyanobacterium]
MLLASEYWWKICLELKLRQANGNAFQDFFSDVMTARYMNDFVRVRPHGQLGDKGCDGYLQSTKQVFACYGAVNGDKTKASYLTSKMSEDFEKAKKNIPELMQEWYMVHNLVDGLPISAVTILNTLASENPTIKFAFFGMELFEEKIDNLDHKQINKLLGPCAINQDSLSLQTEELRDLIQSIAEAAEIEYKPNLDIKPVPVDKLDANQLPGHWKSLISGGWQNAHLVVSYLNKHHDPLIGERIAQYFSEKYRYLKSQDLSSSNIMTTLYEFATGSGSVRPERQVAAQALLAHLFESCDIFENISLEANK